MCMYLLLPCAMTLRCSLQSTGLIWCVCLFQSIISLTCLVVMLRAFLPLLANIGCALAVLPSIGATASTSPLCGIGDGSSMLLSTSSLPTPDLSYDQIASATVAQDRFIEQLGNTDPMCLVTIEDKYPSVLRLQHTHHFLVRWLTSLFGSGRWQLFDHPPAHVLAHYRLNFD